MRPSASPGRARQAERASIEELVRRREIPTLAVAIADAQQEPERSGMRAVRCSSAFAEVFERRGEVLRREVHLADFLDWRVDRIRALRRAAPFSATLSRPVRRTLRFLELVVLSSRSGRPRLRDAAANYRAHENHEPPPHHQRIATLSPVRVDWNRLAEA